MKPGKIRWYSLDDCECGRERYPGVLMTETPRYQFKRNQVLLVCPYCEERRARFYLDDELEGQPCRPIKTPRAFFPVTFHRTVAWVGYAKSKHTLQVSFGLEEELVLELIARWFKKAGLVGCIQADVEHEVLYKHLWLDAPYPVRRAIEDQAVAEWRREQMRDGARRGLWLQDHSTPLSGRVIAAVTVQIGNYGAGGQYNDSGDYAPPHLAVTGVHKLWVVELPSEEKVLVHPIDVGEVMDP